MGTGNGNSIYNIKIYTIDSAGRGNSINVSLNIWHDKDYIYFRWFLSNYANFGIDSFFHIKIFSIILN